MLNCVLSFIVLVTSPGKMSIGDLGSIQAALKKWTIDDNETIREKNLMGLVEMLVRNKPVKSKLVGPIGKSKIELT